MKQRNLLWIALVFILAACGGKQPVPVSIHYESTPSPATEQLLRLHGKFQRMTVRIRMVCMRDGQPHYTLLNEEGYTLPDTVAQLRVAVEPLHSKSVRFILQLDSLSPIVQETEASDVLYSILMETFPNRPLTTADTIPLLAYTHGILHTYVIDGKELQGGSYCDVRDAKLPPVVWRDTFDMPEYIWFDCLFASDNSR